MQEVDSLNIKICEALHQNVNLTDEIRINTINKSFITPYLSKFKDTIIQQQTFEKIFYRLQKNCNAFVLLLPSDPAKNNWEILYEEPEKTISKSECNQLDKHQKYYYQEPNGNKVEVTLKGDFWIARFSDNTFSKLYYRKKGNCQFELEFIESDNLGRKNLSIKGDKYFYTIYRKENDSYKIFTKSNETYYTFLLTKE